MVKNYTDGQESEELEGFDGELKELGSKGEGRNICRKWPACGM